MITTGTFLYMPVKTTDSAPIPLILGQTPRGYFICLPDHETAFELECVEDLAGCFIHYMDGSSAESVAAVAKRAMELLFYCER
jgi:hypothetical protein